MNTLPRIFPSQISKPSFNSRKGILLSPNWKKHQAVSNKPCWRNTTFPFGDFGFKCQIGNIYPSEVVTGYSSKSYPFAFIYSL